ncbi:MAG: ATP phosphoribosyltransferase regulatory subunit [Phycisphaerales bacterium]
MARQTRIQAPKGTRDLYPEETARVRYIQKAWTDTAVRHGFEEIEGPTFETSELYAVKSGEGILGELFQAFSGKDPSDIEKVKATGRAPFALRPEFTPTLARMYAARAQQLQKPTKWFTAGPYFRAERPQRGRLREFLQWNVDVIGDDETPSGRAQADADCIATCIGLLESLGVESSVVKINVNDRMKLDDLLVSEGVARERMSEVHALLDRAEKMPREEWQRQATALGISPSMGTLFVREWSETEANLDEVIEQFKRYATTSFQKLKAIRESIVAPLDEFGISEKWCRPSLSIVRGLAYYTGTVFEAIADGERAVAGGGRYDNLIELMGGPPTPAVGFAMGDVVLGLLLEDKGLMPEGAALLDAISAPPASRRPEVFVLGADDDASDPLVRRLVADLRRGAESERYKHDSLKAWDPRRYEPATGGVRPMHARQSYKSTRNLKKLLSDAERQFSRFAAIVHGEDRVQLRDLDKREEITPKDVPGLPDSVAEFSVSPDSEVYVGRAVQALLA